MSDEKQTKDSDLLGCGTVPLWASGFRTFRRTWVPRYTGNSGSACPKTQRNVFGVAIEDLKSRSE